MTPMNGGKVADKPKVYVVPSHTFGTDVGGCLLLETGEVLWNHLSSNMAWLRLDLTVSFTDRREALEARFPDGYEVVECRNGGKDVPDEVRARNAEWAAAEIASAE